MPFVRRYRRFSYGRSRSAPRRYYARKGVSSAARLFKKKGKTPLAIKKVMKTTTISPLKPIKTGPQEFVVRGSEFQRTNNLVNGTYDMSIINTRIVSNLSSQAINTLYDYEALALKGISVHFQVVHHGTALADQNEMASTGVYTIPLYGYTGDPLQKQFGGIAPASFDANDAAFLLTSSNCRSHKMSTTSGLQGFDRQMKAMTMSFEYAGHYNYANSTRNDTDLWVPTPKACPILRPRAFVKTWDSTGAPIARYRCAIDASAGTDYAPAPVVASFSQISLAPLMLLLDPRHTCIATITYQISYHFKGYGFNPNALNSYPTVEQKEPEGQVTHIQVKKPLKAPVINAVPAEEEYEEDEVDEKYIAVDQPQSGQPSRKLARTMSGVSTSSIQPSPSVRRTRHHTIQDLSIE